MNYLIYQSVIFLVLSFISFKGFAQDESKNPLVCVNDKENVVSSAMEGKWFSKQEGYTLIFKKDTTVLEQIPSKYYPFLEDKTIYSAGYITIKSETKVYAEDTPYFLTVLSGNPHIVWFRERNGDPLGDAESFNVFIAIGETTADDLLYMGGDFNNQPFLRFTRVKK
ncbi:hypothetical protein [Bernardetia sp.]|uniref:hypothetical protein n=1 Tax=Bernardetia sp. TaxID=1937974 RepID=UPI0025C070C7|nr:hypothetical protein [Bernardetia sp.]